MPHHSPLAIITWFAAGVGFVEGVVHLLIETLFDEATVRILVVAVVSACITGAFGIVIARIQRDADRVQHQRLDVIEHRVNDVAGAVGANRRAEDPDASGTPPTATT